MKASELPLNTVIEVDNEQYIKQERDYGIGKLQILWLPLSCEDCCASQSYTEDHADEVLTDYRIIAVPMLVVEFMNAEFAKMTGNGMLLKEALEHVKKYEVI